MRYILASASPRRKELLGRLEIEFEIVPAKGEEVTEEVVPAEIAKALAAAKAGNVYELLAAESGVDITVIGADTIVVYNGEVLGKPKDEKEAFDMLSLLSDRTHEVYTGVCIYKRENAQLKTCNFAECTKVTFAKLSRKEILDYIATGDPMDKAGAYGIQGVFAKHVKGIEGDYNNVVGLPVAALYESLKGMFHVEH